jgi:hypothetical protein
MPYPRIDYSVRPTGPDTWGVWRARHGFVGPSGTIGDATDWTTMTKRDAIDLREELRWS